MFLFLKKYSKNTNDCEVTEERLRMYYLQYLGICIPKFNEKPFEFCSDDEDIVTTAKTQNTGKEDEDCLKQLFVLNTLQKKIDLTVSKPKENVSNIK